MVLRPRRPHPRPRQGDQAAGEGHRESVRDHRGPPRGRIVNRARPCPTWRPFKAASDRGVALEINASPYRLDLRDTHARIWVQEYGGKLAINTDAHEPEHLDNPPYVVTARRAGATKGDVVNAMSQAALAEWIKSTRK